MKELLRIVHAEGKRLPQDPHSSHELLDRRGKLFGDFNRIAIHQVEPQQAVGMTQEGLHSVEDCSHFLFAEVHAHSFPGEEDRLIKIDLPGDHIRQRHRAEIDRRFDASDAWSLDHLLLGEPTTALFERGGKIEFIEFHASGQVEPEGPHVPADADVDDLPAAGANEVA